MTDFAPAIVVNSILDAPTAHNMQWGHDYRTYYPYGDSSSIEQFEEMRQRVEASHELTENDGHSTVENQAAALQEVNYARYLEEEQAYYALHSNEITELA